MAASPHCYVMVRGPPASVPESFAVPALLAAFPAAVLKGWIRTSGELVGFSSTGWDLYLTSATGQREGEPLSADHPFTPVADSIVNVWVEPKPGAASAGGGGGAVAAAGGGGDGGLVVVERTLQRIVDLLTAKDEADEASAATPQEYEEEGRRMLVDALEVNFGLRVVSGARVHRLDKEIIAALGGSTFDSEWDFRAPVMCSGDVPPRPGKTSDFIIYPDQEAYIRPDRPPRAKQLTPTKIAGSASPPPCDFVAIFEITTSADWAKGLVPRLEQRLTVSRERARALNDSDSVKGILDVVAVVGVVGAYHCQRAITTYVTPERSPLLYEMMQAARFVFLRKSFVGSPAFHSASSQSGGRSRGPKSPLGPGGDSRVAAGGGGGGDDGK